MRQLTNGHLTELLADHQPPCISLYQATHRNHPENQQDPIRYRNLLAEMEKSLLQKYSTREVHSLLEKFQAFAHDDGFWNHRTDGLAILSSPDTFQLFELQRTVKTLLVVADSFHTKPLLRALQAADRFQILGLNRHEAKLYEGNQDALDEVELADAVPATIKEALGSELTEPHATVASYGMGAGGGDLAMHHGHGQKKDEVEIDNDRFFRAIDRAIMEHHSRPTNLPLMLAALPLPIFVTTSYHDFLEVALRERAGKRPHTEICVWNDSLRAIPSVFEHNPDYQPTPEEPLVYHLHGFDAYPESLVLTEDDYLDFLAYIAKDPRAIHPRVRQALTDSSLVMIGYHPQEWDFRVIFRGLVATRPPGMWKTSIAIQLEHEPLIQQYIQRYLRQARFDVEWTEAGEFIAELYRGWRG
jgi:hypothetical protein